MAGREVSPQEIAKIVLGRRGLQTALVTGESGKEMYLHSLYDPEEEALSHVPAHIGHDVLVFLGTGLGYHIPLVLKEKPGVKRVVLVEKYHDLAMVAAARIKSSGIKVDIITTADTDSGVDAPAVPQDIESRNLQIIIHPPSLNANPSWYARCHEMIATAGLFQIPSRKTTHAGTPGTVLVLFGSYYGQRESIRGFEQLGHQVVTVDYRGSDEETIDKVRREVIEKQPDLVFCINMRGLDKHGVICGILARLGIPLAVWFVDSPEFIWHGQALPCREITTVFLWDRSYLAQVRKLGYTVFYLPLAADPQLQVAAIPAQKFRAGLTFVGNSRETGFFSRLAERFPQNPETRTLLGRAVETVLANRGNQLESLDRVLQEGKAGLFRQGQELYFRGYAIHSATTRYRTMLLRKLLPLGLTFFGDPDGWRKVFGDSITAYPDVHYFAETPAVYASSDISFNATSLQMPMAVNQRVFDVPLCGGFLLTDRQEALFELFAENEVAVYEGPGDVAERAADYLAEPRLRRDIARKARERVLGEHTYMRRMGELLEHLWS